MTREEAVNELASRGRDIVTVELAQRIAGAFDQDVRELDLVYTVDEVGENWSTRATYTQTGEMVSICTLACVLVSTLELPDIDYPTDYIGAGKRAGAITAKAVKQLRIAAGEDVPTCEVCGTYNIWPGGLGPEAESDTVRCWGCIADARDRATPAIVWETHWPDGHTLNSHDMTGLVTYEVNKGGKHPWPDEEDALPFCRSYFANKAAAIEQAEELHREDGMEDVPVEIRQRER